MSLHILHCVEELERRSEYRALRLRGGVAELRTRRFKELRPMSSLYGQVKTARLIVDSKLTR